MKKMKKMKKGLKLVILIAPLTLTVLLTTPTLAGEDDLTENQVHTLHRSPSVFELKPNQVSQPQQLDRTGLSAEQYSAQFRSGKNYGDFMTGISKAKQLVDTARLRFGVKTNPYDSLIENIDVSFPNLYQTVWKDLDKYPIEATDCTSALDSGQLHFLLTDSRSPFSIAIQDCLHPTDQEDQTNSKLNGGQIDCLVNLLTCQGSTLCLDGLNDQHKNQVINTLKEIAGSKTGFQGLMSLLIVTTLNSDPNLCFNKNLTTIKIKFDPRIKNACYQPSTQEIVLKKLYFADFDRTLFHELNHAKHDALNVATWNIPLSFTYFSAAKNQDLRAKLIPANLNLLPTPLKVDFADHLKNFLIRNGLGELCAQLTAEETYSLVNELRRIKLGTNNDDDLWINSDEMTTILGICPLFIDQQLYVIEDRQSEAMYQQRKLDSTAKKTTLESIYVTHNAQPCSKIIESIFSRTALNCANYRIIPPENQLAKPLDQRPLTIDGEVFQTSTTDLEKPPAPFVATTRTTTEKTKKYPIAISDDGEELLISANLAELDPKDFYVIPLELKRKIQKITFADHCQVTEIPNCCFSDFSNLKQINFARQMNLTSIGTRAFGWNRKGIESINNLPKSLKSIGDEAFRLSDYARITFEDNSSSLENISSESLMTVSGENKTFALRSGQLPRGLSRGVTACLTQNYQGLLHKKETEEGTVLVVEPEVITLPIDLMTYQDALRDDDFYFDQISKITFSGRSNLKNLTGITDFYRLATVRIPASLVQVDFAKLNNGSTEQLLLRYVFENKELETSWGEWIKKHHKD